MWKKLATIAMLGAFALPVAALAQGTDRDMTERPDLPEDEEDALRALLGADGGVRITRVDSVLKKRDFCIRMDWPDGWSCIYCERGGMMCVCSGDCR